MERRPTAPCGEEGVRTGRQDTKRTPTMNALLPPGPEPEAWLAGALHAPAFCRYRVGPGAHTHLANINPSATVRGIRRHWEGCIRITPNNLPPQGGGYGDCYTETFLSS